MLHLGGIARLEGKASEGRHLLEESVINNMNIGNQRGIAQALRFLADTAFAQKNYAEARKFYSDSLAIHREFDNRSGIVLTLGGLGDVALADGEIEKANENYREAYQMASAVRDIPLILWVLSGMVALLAKRGEIPHALEVAGLVMNHFATPQEVGDKVVNILADLHIENDRAFTEALERGRLMANNASRGNLGLDAGHWLLGQNAQAAKS
jgi:tetratricopeptide (TPR) repeat protein